MFQPPSLNDKHNTMRLKNSRVFRWCVARSRVDTAYTVGDAVVSPVLINDRLPITALLDVPESPEGGSTDRIEQAYRTAP